MRVAMSITCLCSGMGTAFLHHILRTSSGAPASW
jgi:hypothetical protein